jgi:hypothetical protein
MDKECRTRTDILLMEALKKKREVMRETLEALAEEVEKFKNKKLDYETN